MDFVKKYLKLIIGIAVLVFVIIMFSMTQRGGDLENGNLRNWLAAPIERRAAAAKILSGSDQHTELIMQCIDKIASLPESGEMAVRDAASLCYTGVQLKENL